MFQLSTKENYSEQVQTVNNPEQSTARDVKYPHGLYTSLWILWKQIYGNDLYKKGFLSRFITLESTAYCLLVLEYYYKT